MSGSVIGFTFLTEIAKQSLGEKPSGFFPKFILPRITKNSNIYEALNDFTKAKTGSQVQKVLVDEAQDKLYKHGQGIYDAVKYVLITAVKVLKSYVVDTNDEEMDVDSEGAGFSSEIQKPKKTKYGLNYGLPILKSLGSIALVKELNFPKF